MPPVNPEARAYARALLELAEATGSLESIEKAMPVAADLLRRNVDMRRFLADPKVRIEGKTRALRKLLDDKAPPALKHILEVMLHHDHTALLDSMASSFYDEVARRRGKTNGELVAAVQPSDRKVKEIQEAAGRVLGRDVELRVRVDPDLLGGFLVQVGDFVLDGTVNRQLESMRRQLLS